MAFRERGCNVRGTGQSPFPTDELQDTLTHTLAHIMYRPIKQKSKHLFLSRNALASGSPAETH